MKIAFLLDSLSRSAGGVYHSASGLFRAVQRAVRVPPRIVCSSASEVVACGGRNGEVGVRPCIASQWMGLSPGLHRHLETLRPDLVHVHGIWRYTSIAALCWRGPRVVSLHGMLHPWALNHRWFRKRVALMIYERKHLSESSCLIALNTAELAAIRAAGFKTPVAIVPNGIELPLPTHGMRRAGPRTCLYLGRLHRVKGIEGLLRAWARLRPNGWELVIAGWGADEYEAKLRALGAAGVRFVGPKFGAEKDQLLRDASAFVLPSLSEGLPMAVLEAWAHGLPVGMTENCNLPEGFSRAAAVRLGPDGEGLERLLGMDEDQLAAMGMCGRRLVEEKFTWDRVARKMVSVYEWVLGLGPAPESVELT